MCLNSVMLGVERDGGFEQRGDLPGAIGIATSHGLELLVGSPERIHCGDDY